ncbi:MAG: acyl-CoA dehydrogenase [Acidimicrobiia bacterium]|nr:acyl-CoA dehydrogenase [Acidimicrobiia bacterium]
MSDIALANADETTASTTHLPPADGEAILANARAAAGVLQEEAEAGERARRLTDRAQAALRATGVFRMSMPRSWSGPEVDLPTQLAIIEALSAADGSAGWCAMIGSDGGYISAALDDHVGRSLYADLDAVTAGWVQPGGELLPVEGGYLLSGRWQFASGCAHADVMIGGAMVSRDGRAVVDSDGRPEVRVAVLPADRFDIIDHWNPTGLAGSGSHDYAAHDVLVPADQTFCFGDQQRPGPLYAWPGLFAAHLVGVPLGIARAALDDAEALLRDKVLTPSRARAVDDAHTRATIARGEAMVGSARSYAFDVTAAFWATLVAGDEPSLRQRAALAGCHAHVARTCRDAVEMVGDVVGTASIRREHAVERHRRDLVTLCQHVLIQQRVTELAGALWLGVADPDDPRVTNRVL